MNLDQTKKMLKLTFSKTTIKEDFFDFLTNFQFERAWKNLQKIKVFGTTRNAMDKEVYYLKEDDSFLKNLEYYDLESLILIKEGTQYQVGYEMFILATCLYKLSGVNSFHFERDSEKIKKFHSKYDNEQLGGLFELLFFFDELLQKNLESRVMEKDRVRQISNSYNLNESIMVKIYKQLVLSKKYFPNIKKVLQEILIIQTVAPSRGSEIFYIYDPNYPI